MTGDDRIAKISLVGVGMRSHAGIASRMFEALAEEAINIQMISTSEIKISVVVDEKYVELGVRALHAAFGLEQERTRGIERGMPVEAEAGRDHGEACGHEREILEIITRTGVEGASGNEASSGGGAC